MAVPEEYMYSLPENHTAVTKTMNAVYKSFYKAIRLLFSVQYPYPKVTISQPLSAVRASHH